MPVRIAKVKSFPEWEAASVTGYDMAFYIDEDKTCRVIVPKEEHQRAIVTHQSGEFWGWDNLPPMVFKTHQAEENTILMLKDIFPGIVVELDPHPETHDPLNVRERAKKRMQV